MSMCFPPGFLFGVATSAYQIEGAADEDGRGPSMWDTFCGVPGAVTHGDTGAIACDHYHRTDADLDLAAGLGLNAYRFSVGWPRIVPDGTGAVNQKGLDYYRRLVDGLRARGLEPMATLYHWDLPQPLQDAGGWVNRDTIAHFCDYVQLVLDSLADLVPAWVTMNEPFCSGMIGHLQARHAPGLADLHSALAASHHLLLAHGLAMSMIRDRAPQARAGITHLLSDIHAASDSEADQAAARRLDGHENRWFLDPVLRGSYPADMLDWYQRQVPLDFIRDGDLDVIAAPADFLGINYYETKLVAADPAEPYHQARVIPAADYTDPAELTAGGIDTRPAWAGSCAACTGPPRSPSTSPRTARPTTITLTPRVAWTTWSGSRTWLITSPRPWPRSRPGWTCAATSSGRCWTTSSGPTGTAAGSASSGSTSARRPASPRPAPAGTPSSSPASRRSSGPPRTPDPPRRHAYFSATKFRSRPVIRPGWRSRGWPRSAPHSAGRIR